MTSTANITHHTTVTMASHSEEEEDLLTDMTPPDVCWHQFKSLLLSLNHALQWWQTYREHSSTDSEHNKAEWQHDWVWEATVSILKEKLNINYLLNISCEKCNWAQLHKTVTWQFCCSNKPELQLLQRLQLPHLGRLTEFDRGSRQETCRENRDEGEDERRALQKRIHNAHSSDGRWNRNRTLSAKAANICNYPQSSCGIT